MDREGLRREIREGTIRPAYLFAGDEDLWKEEAVEGLRKAAGAAASVKRFSANETSANEIVEARQNLSLFDPVGVIVIRQAARLPEAEAEPLRETLANTASGPPIVFSDQKLDRRRKIFSEIARAGALVDFSSPNRRQAAEWVAGEARRLGHPLDRGVAELLVELLGVDLQRLRTTLELLSTAAGPKAAITESLVSDFVPEARAHALYELQDAVGSRRTSEAIRLFRRSLGDGETPYAMVGALYAEVRRLRLARALPPRTSPGEAAAILGTPPFRVQHLLRAARAFSDRHLGEIVDRLAEIDLAIKTGRENGVAALEGWILFACSR